MNEFLTWLLDAVQSVDPLWRTLIAGVAIMLETSLLIGLIVPGDSVVIVAGTAVDSLPEGIILVLVIIAGSLAGESIGFWLGRWLGPVLRFSWIGRKIGERNWARAELYLRRRGGPAIFISRFLPVLHSLVPATVGMTGYPYRRFLAWTLPACAIWATLYVSVTAAAAETYRNLADQLHIAAYLFVAAIVVFALVVVVGKKLLYRAEARHLRVEEPEAEGTVPGDADEDARRGMGD